MGGPVDVAVLTVIPAELEAARLALGLDDRAREKAEDGTNYFHGAVASELTGRDYAVVVACIGGAGNPGAAAKDLIAGGTNQRQRRLAIERARKTIESFQNKTTLDRKPDDLSRRLLPTTALWLDSSATRSTSSLKRKPNTLTSPRPSSQARPSRPSAPRTAPSSKAVTTSSSSSSTTSPPNAAASSSSSGSAVWANPPSPTGCTAG
jgi:hypothetical protein